MKHDLSNLTDSYGFDLSSPCNLNASHDFAFSNNESQTWTETVSQSLFRLFCWPLERPRWMSKRIKVLGAFAFLFFALLSGIVFVDPQRKGTAVFVGITLGLSVYAWTVLHISFGLVTILGVFAVWTSLSVALLLVASEVYLLNGLAVAIGFFIAANGFLISLSWMRRVLQCHFGASDTVCLKVHMFSLVVLSGFYIDYLYLGCQYFAQTDMKSLYQHSVMTLSVFYSMVLGTQWVPIHFKIFKPEQPQEHVLVTEMYATNLPHKDFIVEAANALDSGAGCWQQLYENTHRILSFSIILSLISCELGVAYLSSYYRSDSSTLSAMHFFLCGAPFAVCGGLSFVSRSSLSKSVKVICISMSGALAVMISMPLSFVLEVLEHQKLVYLLRFGVPAVFMFWLTQVFIYKWNKRLFQLLTGLACFGIGVPCACILLFFEEYHFLAQGSVCIALLMLICLKIIPEIRTYLPFFKLLKMREESKTRVEIAQWTISAVFILSLTFLTVAGASAKDSRDQGILYASCTLVVCVYVASVLISKARVYIYQLPTLSLSELIVLKWKDQQNIWQGKQGYERTRWVLTVFWAAVLLIAGGFGVYGAGEDEEFWRAFGVHLLKGSIALSVLSFVVLRLKQRLKQYSKHYVSYLCAWSYCFVLFPVLVAIPIVFSSSQALASVSKYGLSLCLLLMVLGAAAFSVFISHFIAKIQKERSSLQKAQLTVKYMESVGVKVEQEAVLKLQTLLNRLDMEEAVTQFKREYRCLYLDEQSTFSQYLLRQEEMTQFEEARLQVSTRNTQDLLLSMREESQVYEDPYVSLTQALAVSSHESMRSSLQNKWKRLCPCLTVTAPEVAQEAHTNVFLTEGDVFPSRVSHEEERRIVNSDWFMHLNEHKHLQVKVLKTVFNAFVSPNTTMDKTLFHHFAHRTCLAELECYTRRRSLINERTPEINAEQFARWIALNFSQNLVQNSATDPLAGWLGLYVAQLFDGIEEFILNECVNLSEDPIRIQASHLDSQFSFGKEEKHHVGIRCKQTVSIIVEAIVSSINWTIGTLCFFPPRKQRETTCVGDRNKQVLDFDTILDCMVEAVTSQMWEYIDCREKLKLNASTIFAVAEMILELYGFSVIAFHEGAGWQSEEILNVSVVYGGLTSHFDQFYLRFTVSAILIVIFCLCVCLLALKLRKNTLGRTNDGQLVGWTSWEWWIEGIVRIIGKGLYLFVFATMFSGVSCGLIEDQWQLTAFHDEEVLCFEGVHWWYFSLGFLGLLFYYCYATVVFAILQSQNESLSFRYDLSYAVFEAQGKTVVAALFILFENEGTFYQIQLGTTILVCLVLSGYTLKTSPCWTQPYNRIKGLSFLVPAVCCGVALVRSGSDAEDDLFLWLIMTGLIGIVAAIVITHCWRENNRVCCLKKKGKPISSL